MKFIHLADLHIGKRLYEYSLIDDQRIILGKILSIIDDEKPDGVIIAGDIYDKPVPPAEAVEVFDSFLTAISKRNIPVFIVSGNHDSAERIAFASRILDGSSVYISPVYDGTVKHVTMEDEYGPLTVWLLPFLKPATVKHAFPDADINSYNDAVKTAIDNISATGNNTNTGTKEDARTEVSKGRNVLVAHQFVTGAARCDSEEVSVGGLDNVDVSVFDGFDYVALGHIHSPQSVGRETVRYCGTPLKYSFSEADQTKSVTVAELREKGNVTVRTVPLIPERDLKKIRGSYMEITARSFYENINTEDYIQATLTDEDDIPDGMAKLRVIYKNLTNLLYDNRRTRQNREIEETDNIEQKSELELFEEFYEQSNNQPMNDEQRGFCAKLIDELKGI